jgi:MarR family transcriptional regulator, transcriptional regulator for hemolysin
MGLGHDPDTESVGRLLFLTSKAAKEVLEARMQAQGASHTAWLVLHALIDHGLEGSQQRALAEHLFIEGPTMTRHLDRLEAEGLIERRPDPEDRRSTLIVSTAAGKRTSRRLMTVMEQAQADLLSGLSRSEIETLTHLMQRVRDNVERAADRESVPVVRHPPHVARADREEKEGATHVR